MVRILLRPFMWTWATAAGSGRGLLPKPEDEPRALGPGPDPRRVLLVGSGPAVGWGVRTHELALPGYLARELAELTGRGAEVDVRAATDSSIRTVQHLLEDGRLPRYDAVVLLAGMWDAVSLTSVRVWRKALTALIDRVRSELAPDAPLLVMGIQRPSTVSLYSAWPGRIADRHAAVLNAASRTLCQARPEVYYADLTEPNSAAGRPGHRSPGIYRDWGRAVAEALAPHLPLRSVDPATPSEGMGQGALDASRLVRTERRPRIDRLAALASELFGTRGAAVTFLDHDRGWHKSVVGMELPELERERSLCDRAVRAGRLVVHPDLWSEPEFEDSLLVHGEPGIRFYAGYPIESPEGFRLGVLSVFDPAPRTAPVDGTLLRELAFLVQKEVWAESAEQDVP